MRSIFFTKLTAKRRGFDNILPWREEGETRSGIHTQYSVFRGHLATAIKIEHIHTF